ncbi:tyrosine-type recombinase/integrase [Virgibacillus oceani]
MAIYKDKKRDTWYISVYIGDGGKRKRIVRRGFKTRPEAKKAEAEIIFNAEMYNSDNPLFTDIVDEFINSYEKQRKATSVHRLKKECRLYIKPFFEGKYIQNIKKRDIKKFHDFLLDKLSMTSAKNVHGYLSSILNYAVEMEYLNSNVAREVGNIRGSDDKEMDYWTLDEFKLFLTHVEDNTYKALFMTLFYSGMRLGEAIALTWKDVDFDNNIIHINKTANLNKITTPKTKTSIRKIKMPQHTMNAIATVKLETKPKHDYFVFGEYCTHKPRTTVTNYFIRYIRRINKSVNLKQIRVHDLRHSHASYLINKGYDIQIISKRLGHAKVSTTYDIYAHLYPNKEDEAIKDMEDDFKSADVIKFAK